MNLVWTAIGGGIIIWALMHLWLRRNAAGSDALGAVSDHWLAEHRLDRTESQR